MWPSLPLMVTVTVPSPFDSMMNGPARAGVAVFPLAGLAYVTWTSSACVTSFPSA